MAKQPVLVGLKVCKDVIVDETTHHVTFVNCLRRLLVPKVPTPPQELIVTGALAGGLGEMALTLKLLESGPQEIVFTHSWIIQLTDPLEERSVYIRLRRVTFPAFGRYEFVLWVHDDWFAHCNISVLKGSLP